MEAQNKFGFRKAWVNQLYQEYESVCWAYAVNMKKPLIELSNAQSYWGNWNPRSRTLTISSHLIQKHSWDIVKAVLKHEMAHQIVTDIFRAREKHGPIFHQACDMIGVPEEFVSSGGDIPRELPRIHEEDALSEGRTILEKVRKLFSLAQSSNEHEAALAMQKANELIEKYNVNRLEQERESRYVHLIIELKRKRIENYHKRICSILMDFFYVQVVLSQQYEARKDDHFRIIDIMGTRENVLIAEYVYHFLMNQLQFLWQDYQKKTGTGARGKRSYWLGILRGFWEKLHDQEEKRPRNHSFSHGRSALTSHLVVAGDHELTHFSRRRYPRVSQKKEAAAKIHQGSFMAGMEDGRELTLHQGLTEEDGNQGRLIGEGARP